MAQPLIYRLINRGLASHPEQPAYFCSWCSQLRRMEVRRRHSTFGELWLCGPCALAWDISDVGARLQNADVEEYVGTLGFFLSLLRRIFHRTRSTGSPAPAAVHSKLATAIEKPLLLTVPHLDQRLRRLVTWAILCRWCTPASHPSASV